MPTDTDTVCPLDLDALDRRIALDVMVGLEAHRVASRDMAALLRIAREHAHLSADREALRLLVEAAEDVAAYGDDTRRWTVDVRHDLALTIGRLRAVLSDITDALIKRMGER